VTGVEVCRCGHDRAQHSGAREDDFGCNVPGCYASGKCSGFSPEDTPLDPFADPAASTALPEPRTSSAETQDQRERRCRFWRNCTCSHTDCMDGWLDEEEPNPSSINPHNIAVRKCSRCRDAQEMHAELAGMRGKR
jgi:hypothetical protein